MTNPDPNGQVLEREKWAKVGGWRGTADTIELVEKSHKMYLDKVGRERGSNLDRVFNSHGTIHIIPSLQKKQAAVAK